MRPVSALFHRLLQLSPVLLAFAALGCQSLPWLDGLFAEKTVEIQEVVPISPEIYRRADHDRAERLEAQVQRLRGDLKQAEEALVQIESGLRGDHSRAAAVSSLAEARIELDRAARVAAWRTGEIQEALSKLDEADAQIQQGNYGAAVFFVYRARRIARSLTAEARQLARTPAARVVRGARVNLRDGPSTDESKVKSVAARTRRQIRAGRPRSRILQRAGALSSLGPAAELGSGLSAHSPLIRGETLRQ